MKIRLVICCICLLFGSKLIAQGKWGELKISAAAETTLVVRPPLQPDQSLLHIISEISDLSFESTLRILRTQKNGASEWWVVVDSGRQSLAIKATKYKSANTETTRLKAQRAYRLEVSQVKPIPGTLYVKTKPDSADLYLNGPKLGTKTSLRLDLLPASYNVKVVKEGYRSVETTLDVESDKDTTWVVELTQTAVRVQINLINKLSEVGILINNEAKGVAPGPIYLEPGNYRLLLKKKGYKYTEKVIEIALGPEEIQFTEELQKPLLRKWWFWPGSVALAVGTASIFWPNGTAPPPPESLASHPEFP